MAMFAASTNSEISSLVIVNNTAAFVVASL
jgi:hypothetical protein